jgi:hypothetical protein
MTPRVRISQSPEHWHYVPELGDSSLVVPEASLSEGKHIFARVDYCPIMHQPSEIRIYEVYSSGFYNPFVWEALGTPSAANLSI